jgi:DNA-binding XRE family transcriptional regulator
MATLMSNDNVSPVATGVFAQFFRAYLECDDEVQAIIRRQTAVATDREADEDDRALALSTVYEALFPESSPYDGQLGINLADLERFATGEDRAAVEEMDRQEATFSERLNAMMVSQGMTQAQLADAIGIGQPAISNLLNRKSRPQSRTVAKLARALGVTTNELWPTR